MWLKLLTAWQLWSESDLLKSKHSQWGRQKLQGFLQLALEVTLSLHLILFWGRHRASPHSRGQTTPASRGVIFGDQLPCHRCRSEQKSVLK